MKGIEIEFYVKTKGYDLYSKCTGSARKSGKGYTILTVTSCEPMSRYSYYRANSSRRFILADSVEAGKELHEVGHRYMFEALGLL